MNAAMTTDVKPLSPVMQQLAIIRDEQQPVGVRIMAIGKVMEANKNRIFAALPHGFSADRMIRIVMTAIRKNTDLLSCSPASIFEAVTEAATMGWEIGGAMGHAYLVPFKDQCTMIPGYKGLLDLCYRSGQVQTINFQVVRQGDTFSYSLGDDPKVTHLPNDADPLRDQKPITHAYGVAKLKNGGVQRDVWAINRLHEHRDRYCRGYASSVAYLEKAQKMGWTVDERKLSPWQTAEAVMCMKTVARNMVNRGMIPISAEYRGMLATKELLEDSVGMDTLDSLPAPSMGDGDVLPPPQNLPGEEFSDPLDGIEAKFAAIKILDEVNALYTSLCGPNAKEKLSDDESKLVDQWRAQAAERITGKRPRQK